MLRPWLFLLLLTVTPLAAEFELVRVWPGYRSADSFVSIGEYFGGDETTGGRTIARSQPNARGGFYWLVRTRSSAAVAAATVEIGVLRSGETEPAFHRFTVAIPAGRHPLLIGLTGSDWPDPEERPVAWQVRVLDESAELAHEQSFLWSVPSKSP